MHLKKLEIFGFKSFAEKVTLNFEQGITAIVGPNGCGKSNVFDSVRWVLGEQSMKELRGATKEDVIFNGTATKPALGFAEVSLTFFNKDRVLDIDYDEVTIARRVFRSGESEYLLNKTAVRLKDIQELLMGTGIGAEAYSLIQQGKVDTVVSARPEERRQLLDEAAGITKYKMKRREALLKLKSTDDNLLRVNDITIEVKRQIASIERQANKAKKYKEEFDKLKDLEIQLAHYQLNNFTEEKNKIDENLESMRSKEQSLLLDLEELAKKLEVELEQLSTVEQSINDLHAEEIKLDADIESHNRQIGFNEERINHLSDSEIKFNEQKQVLVERCKSNQEKIDELQVGVDGFDAQLSGYRAVVEAKREELSVLEKALEEAQNRIKLQQEKSVDLTTDQVSVRNDLTEIMKEMQGCLAKQKRLEIENNKVIEERQEVQEKSEKYDSEIQTLQLAIEEYRTKKSMEENVLRDLRTHLKACEDRSIQLEKSKLFSQSQKEFVEIFETQYDTIPESSDEQHFITKIPPTEKFAGVMGRVKSVERLEGDEEKYKIICENKYIELDPEKISSNMSKIKEDIQAVSQQKIDYANELEKQIQMCELCVEELQNAEKKISVLESQKEEMIYNLHKLTEEMDVITSEFEEVAASITKLKASEDELNQQMESVNQNIGLCQSDAKQIQDWIAVKVQEKENVVVAIAQSESDIQAQKDKFSAQKNTLQMLEESLNSALREIKNIDEEVSGYTVKKETYLSEIQNFSLAIEEMRSTKEQLVVEQSEYIEQKMAMGSRINEARSNMTQSEDQVKSIKQKVHEILLSEQRLEFTSQGIKDKLVQTYKINLDEIALTLNAENAEANTEEVFDEATVIDQVTKLRKRCDAFGNVNLVAIEEFEELKERFEFLTKQQSDLFEAKSQLMSTINKINRASKQMFMDTFTKVNSEFQAYFRLLFGGGEAQLILLEPDNVLESGIEIMAQPPGKKLQSISLLSGGERTMTAIALIFGVFKVKPSPFCILDEIDAALDEANVDRYSNLLKVFAKVAQFIVITHNKKTIAHADVLYGITMPETGISRVVSVKLSEKETDVKSKNQVSAGV